jgi:hypothetical protein
MLHLYLHTHHVVTRAPALRRDLHGFVLSGKAAFAERTKVFLKSVHLAVTRSTGSISQRIFHAVPFQDLTAALGDIWEPPDTVARSVLPNIFMAAPGVCWTRTLVQDRFSVT